jgi:osmotically-inducible protein OsmY
MKIRIATLACALLLGGTAFAADKPAASNADKEKKLAALLVDKLGKDAETIHVTVVAEKVTLTGEVADRGTQELSVEVVKYADTKAKIDNQLKCTSEKSLTGGKTEDEMADSKLEKHVRGKVKDELGKNYKPVYIECTGGTCTVRGTVPDQARKDIALKTTAGVEGVKKVVDLLRIKG